MSSFDMVIQDPSWQVDTAFLIMGLLSGVEENFLFLPFARTTDGRRQRGGKKVTQTYYF